MQRANKVQALIEITKYVGHSYDVVYVDRCINLAL